MCCSNCIEQKLYVMINALFAKLVSSGWSHDMEHSILYASMCGCVCGCVNTLKPKKWINLHP